MTLLTALGFNKIWIYGLLALLVTSSLAIAILRIKASGAAAERLKEMDARNKQMQKETLARAKVDTLDGNAARQRLRERWLRK